MFDTCTFLTTLTNVVYIVSSLATQPSTYSMYNFVAIWYIRNEGKGYFILFLLNLIGSSGRAK